MFMGNISSTVTKLPRYVDKDVAKELFPDWYVRMRMVFYIIENVLKQFFQIR